MQKQLRVWFVNQLEYMCSRTHDINSSILDWINYTLIPKPKDYYGCALSSWSSYLDYRWQTGVWTHD